MKSIDNLKYKYKKIKKISKKRESLFKSEKEQSFCWGITPNKSESLLKSEM